MEKISFDSERGAVRGILSGQLENPKFGLICLHGGPGGDLHGNTNIFDDIAVVTGESGGCTLQYSVYGAFPSDGTPADITINSQMENLSKAVDFFKDRYDCPFYLVGESAGATIVARTWNKEAKGYILLWPAFDLSNTDLKPYIQEKWMTIATEHGYLDDNGVVIGIKLLQEILSIDFSESFDLPEKPIFIAHGQKDEEVPYSQSLKAIQSAKAELIFVSHPLAGHGFKSVEERVFLLKSFRAWIDFLINNKYQP